MIIHHSLTLNIFRRAIQSLSDDLEANNLESYASRYCLNCATNIFLTDKQQAIQKIRKAQIKNHFTNENTNRKFYSEI